MLSSPVLYLAASPNLAQFFLSSISFVTVLDTLCTFTRLIDRTFDPSSFTRYSVTVLIPVEGSISILVGGNANAASSSTPMSSESAREISSSSFFEVV